MTKSFDGTVALVTGGGSGIGRATALSFAQREARVAVVGRTKEKIEETVEIIKGFGGEAIAVHSDVSIEAQVKSMIDKTMVQFGRLDFACNAAAINGKFGPMIELTEDDFDSIVEVNLKGIWLCMKHQIRQMLAQNSGAIVNISSINGLAGTKGASIYSASKYGVIGLTKSAALEYANSNIRINSICPGAIQTPGLDEAIAVTGKNNSIIASEVPMGRIGNPEEIANAVTWLCSDDAAFVTGHVMVIDGGEMA
jgi:NAD(P)-dependent dehydrogenase (short-subunit alcohol dehydrogenase family)